MTTFPENVQTPYERKFSALSVGAFTFAGNLSILKLLAIFELPYRLARPKLLFLALGCPPRAQYMNLGSASSLSFLYKAFRWLLVGYS